MTDVFEEYTRRLGGPIPQCQIMGNKVFIEQFDEDVCDVYEYCLIHNKKWEEVLHYTEREDVLY